MHDLLCQTHFVDQQIASSAFIVKSLSDIFRKINYGVSSNTLFLKHFILSEKLLNSHTLTFKHFSAFDKKDRGNSCNSLALSLS